MKTKFIEGTNKQYSIREDGQIKQLYSFQKGNRYKGRIVKITNGKVCIMNRHLSFKKILYNHFEFKYCNKCKTKFIPNSGVEIVCNPCIKKRDSIHNRNYRLRYPDANKQRDKDYRDKIGIGLITVRCKCKKEELTPEIIKLYRETLSFKRKVSNELNIHIHTFNK